MEEDWQFYRGGFIEASLPILETRKEIMSVWIRSERDTNGHKHDGVYMSIKGIDFALPQLSHADVWHGFTFNPSLRRLSDWKAHRGYSSIATFDNLRPWYSEAKIGGYYKRKGYRAAIIRGNGYVKHIGNNRGIRE